MPRKYLKKPRKGGRRLGGPGSGRRPANRSRANRPGIAFVTRAAPRLAAAGRYAYARATGQRYYKPGQKAAMRAENLSASDNIITLPLTSIGIPRKPSFAEKVARVERPPILFKRNYQFNAEGDSGRKAWFNMNFNHYSNDINTDISTYKMNLTTDQTVADDTLTESAVWDKARYYVDYMSTKLQFMNSGSNALTGKIHLFAYKRDCRSQYNNVPVNAVNLMMYYSTFGRPLLTGSTNFEATVGNGFNFNTSTAGSNYQANYNMPGSSINTSGICALTDLALSPFSTHVKENVAFWLKPVFSQSFSLKPGQQCNKIIKFHDLPQIYREQLDLEFYAGISYALAVEFQGQVVGSDDLVAGIGVVSTGSSQLSVIREDIRILGQKNGLKSKVMLQTSPLSMVPEGNQVIINPDTGVQLDSYVDDN